MYHIPQGEAEVFCEDNIISIAIRKASMKGIDQNWLQLRDPTCSLTSNDTHILGMVSLDTCGTTMEVEMLLSTFSNLNGIFAMLKFETSSFLIY